MSETAECQMCPMLKNVGGEKVYYICDAVNCCSFELAVVEFLNGGTEIGHGLVLNKSDYWSVV
jgi:hypothetical protein